MAIELQHCKVQLASYRRSFFTGRLKCVARAPWGSALWVWPYWFSLAFSMAINMHTSHSHAVAQQLSTPPTIKELRVWVDGLANRNAKPRIARHLSESWPIFADDFDFDEQKRVQERLQSLPALEGDDLWWILWEYSSDERYSLTYYNYLESAQNATVGDLCREMAEGDLLFAYRQFAIRAPGTETVAQDYASWTPRVEEGFLAKEWFEARKTRKLWELQIEMCEWAITKAPALEKLSAAKRHEFVKKVSTEIERLKKTHEPAVQKRRFRGEAYAIVNREDAQKYREKYSKYIPED